MARTDETGDASTREHARHEGHATDADRPDVATTWQAGTDARRSTGAPTQGDTMSDDTDSMHDDTAISDEGFVPLGDALSRWSHSPTMKQRNAVRYELGRLFEHLAPERRPARGAAKPPARVEEHRSPRGCILQSAASAVSVSWFAAADTDMALGELVVSVWRGVVSHPGSAHRARGGAVMLRELTLRPVEVAPAEWRWRATDQETFATTVLAAWCREQLEQQIVSTDPVEPVAVPA